MKPRDKLKILLLQIRNHALVRKEEIASFANYGNITKDQITVLNVFDTPCFDPEIANNFDAVFVGGASECPVTDEENYPFIKYSKELLLHCIKIDMPVFASCYGFQLVVLALGGKITHVEKDFEMGSLPIKLTDAAKEDPVFHSTPNNFLAISVHQDKAIESPIGCTTLAYTDECIHAFRVDNKPFWCFQFHPEVDRVTLIERLSAYKTRYTRDDEHLKNIIDSTHETHESNILLKKFIDYISSN